MNYITTNNTFSNCTSNYTATITTIPATNWYYAGSAGENEWGRVTWGDGQWYCPLKEEEEKVDFCHLCKAPKVEEVVHHTRRTIKGKKGAKDTYEWDVWTEYKFECGTMHNTGDLPEGEVRVVLGDDCIEM
jgi:hypothetical protein